MAHVVSVGQQPDGHTGVARRGRINGGVADEKRLCSRNIELRQTLGHTSRIGLFGGQCVAADDGIKSRV